MTDSEVLAKRDVALQWCRHVVLGLISKTPPAGRQSENPLRHTRSVLIKNLGTRMLVTVPAKRRIKF